MSVTPLRSQPRHSHDDAPDTAADFERLAALPPGPEADELREKLVSAWLPMAHRLARKFRNRGEPLEDLEQVAALGLFKVVDRYDPHRGVAFESFAIPTVIGELKRHFRDYTWDVHVPRRVQNLRNQVRTSIRALSTGLDSRQPTVAQVAEHSGLSEEDVQLGLEALGSYKSLSLDAPAGGSEEDGFALLDGMGRTEPGFELTEWRETVKPLLRRLPDRERRILYLRFFRGQTQSQIAEQLGCSQMHISRLISRTCEHLRREAERDRAAEDAELIAA
ncbi:SigB/SigF/SigG family RNA polymerase sigma factor [Streptomyces albidus (ex Kaewkla and Franco 2022)]|uniref:SigB/SigF/SigG family RNA polymerase sigma factor n=1 Tax=Streptomyces albidus (ex Kaewkla and Franco 2022) TaxID=722709 RepID=UPI0015EE7989|nr:SigB/SigF/SigG family RNA polymerase sigma factor [Streptomyces albidus (ex Kaewkla and Franco 2022)]